MYFARAEKAALDVERERERERERTLGHSQGLATESAILIKFKHLVKRPFFY